jgi:hypothetical protein
LANRKSNSPWGSSYKEGLPSTAVNDTVDIDQNVRATITTGVIDVRTGQWQGIRLSDEQFTIDASHDAVANGAAVLSPQRSNEDFIDMTGYNDLLIALKVSQGGAYAIAAVMGPDTNMYANLTPLNAGSLLRGNNVTSPQDFNTVLVDSSESLTVNVWNIYSIHTNLKNQKLVQFQITNNSGGPSNIEFAYLRVV